MEESDTLANSIFVILRLIAYRTYLASQYVKSNYPEVYSILSYILLAYIAYKIIRLTISSLYSTFRSIVKGLVIAYVLYMVVSIILVLDETGKVNGGNGADIDLESQIILMTSNLIQQLQSTYRLIRILSVALYKMIQRYYQLDVGDIGIDFENYPVPPIQTIPALLYSLFSRL